jgi:hypothetical protein
MAKLPDSLATKKLTITALWIGLAISANTPINTHLRTGMASIRKRIRSGRIAAIRMQNLVSGSILIKCKTPSCHGIFAGDFVFDLVRWMELFTERKIQCKDCEKTHNYSRDDIIPVPSDSPKETEKGAEKE